MARLLTNPSQIGNEENVFEAVKYCNYSRLSSAISWALSPLLGLCLIAETIYKFVNASAEQRDATIVIREILFNNKKEIKVGNFIISSNSEKDVLIKDIISGDILNTHRSIGQIRSDFKQKIAVILESTTKIDSRELIYLNKKLEEQEKKQELIDRLSKCDLSKSESEFSKKSEFFSHLMRNIGDLEIYLSKDPELINANDENQKTLLHHAATLGTRVIESTASEIQQFLFEAPGIDFNIKDLNGDTPVHLAALYCQDRVTRQLFPNFLRQAISRGFDCSIKGKKGYTILHLAALNSQDNHTIPTTLAILFKNNIPNLQSLFNAQSDSGATALYYCISRNSLEDVEMLLKAGAAPLLCGNEKRSPLAAMSELKKQLHAKYVQVAKDPIYDICGGEEQLKIFDDLTKRRKQVDNLARRLQETDPPHYKVWYG